MAGIGFELRKLFDEKGIVAKLRAYAYTGVVVTGPTLLGVAFLMAVQLMGQAFGLSLDQRSLLVCMLTYSLLASLVLSGGISMPVTRYVADALYEERVDLILPSFEGVLGVLVPAGFVVSLVFQLLTGQSLTLVILNVTLFCELLVVWICTSYLTAIKDFRGILTGYLMAIVAAVLMSWLVCTRVGPSVEGLMGAVVLGYGIMLVYAVGLLYRYFPNAHEHYLLWLRWVDMYKDLVVEGVCCYVGLFSYLVVSWLGPEGVEVAHLYYACPSRDLAAFLAYLSVLVTQVTFVVSTEVNFYPSYRHYYDLFNSDGSITEIDAQQQKMLSILERELGDLSLKQLLASALFISVGTTVLSTLPIGFTSAIQQYYVILCIGYCAYAIGNVVALMCLYYSDNRGAAIASVVFAVTATAGSIAAVALPPVNYALGFVVGSLAYLFTSWLMLYRFTRNLPYTILSGQPLVDQERKGILERLSRR